MANVSDPVKETKGLVKSIEEQKLLHEKRKAAWNERVKLEEECIKRGRRLNPKVFFTDDEDFFREFVRTEGDAKLMMDLERDITTALTFLRFKQKYGEASAPINYDEIEY